jgi:hypothetical protein
MLNLSQATVSIGFSICKGAKVRNLVPYSVCSGFLLGPSANKKNKIDAHDLTNTTKWYNLSVTNFTQNKSKHPNNIGGKNERTGSKRIE